MNCPVCGSKLTKHTKDHLDGSISILLEEERKCERCSYHYFFAYGYTKETVGRVSIEESYEDSQKVSELKRKIIDIAIQISKEEIEWLIRKIIRN